MLQATPVLLAADQKPYAQAMPETDPSVPGSCLAMAGIQFAQLVTLGDTLDSWQTEIAAMWRSRATTALPKAFHTKMKWSADKRSAFAILRIYRMRMKVLCG
jgi:hypothetical protein